MVCRVASASLCLGWVGGFLMHFVIFDYELKLRRPPSPHSVPCGNFYIVCVIKVNLELCIFISGESGGINLEPKLI